MSTSVVVLIPAYEPDGRLIDLVRALRNAEPAVAVVVVDDGSGSSHRPIFSCIRDLGCEVIRHTHNLGKGGALKTGLAHIERRYPGDGVVCADSDGQHSVFDILRVADRLRTASTAMVLSQRNFAEREVPIRSRFGNTVTRWLFRLSTGRSIADTQTGLRGYPYHLLRWLQDVPGERYEYELNVLLQAVDSGIGIDTIEISTIYIDDNKTSHFRPLIDSARIYAPLLTFGASSVMAFTVDTVALLLLDLLTGSLLLSVLGARVISSATNFAINRRVVFPHGRNKPAKVAAVQYFALAIGLLGLNYISLLTLQAVGVALLPAKLVTELVLFGVSYAVQRRVVFRSPSRFASTPGPGARVRVDELESTG